MKSRQSTKELIDRIARATHNPLGWAILPGTNERAAVRVTVLCGDNDDRSVWVRHYSGGGANVELVPRATLTHFVAHQPKPLN